MPADVRINEAALADFCHRWKVKELALFGSAVRGGLGPQSDIDLLVTFAPDADWTMFDHYRMEDELTWLFAREVDLVSVRALEENRSPMYREEILDTARVIYAA